MAKGILTNLNLNKNEIQNAVAQNLAVEPSQPKAGQFYYDTVKNTFLFYDGAKWVDTQSAVLSAEDVIKLINQSTGSTKISRERIEGLQEMIENVSMSGTDIVTAINKTETTEKIEQSRIKGLEESFNGKEDAGVAKSLADTAEANAKSYADTKVSDVLNTIRGGAGEAYDTFAEIEVFIKDHRADIDTVLNGVKRYEETVGDGVMTEYIVTHNLDTAYPTVQVYLGKEQVLVDVEATDANTVTLRTSEPQTLTVVVLG